MNTARQLEPDALPRLNAAGPASAPSPSLRWLWTAMLLVAAAIPPLLYLRLIATTGENVLSNDHLLWVPLVDRIASGGYAWSQILRDAFQNGTHELVIPILLTRFFAQAFEWNVNLILYVFVVVAALKGALLQRLIAGDARNLSSLALWPFVSTLVFLPAHVNVFTFSFAATHIGLAELGFVLGLWAALRTERWPGIVVMCFGGLLATWSWGSGLAVWPVFALAVAAREGRRTPKLGALALAAGIACLPYVLYFDPAATPPHLATAVPVHPLRMTVEAIGWPWCDRWANHARALGVGVLGLALLATGFLALRRYRTKLAQWVPSACLLAYGAILVGATVLLRGTLAPWYTTSFVFVWLGLLALAHAAWTHTEAGSWAKAWSLAPPVAIAALLFLGGGYEEKAFYLWSRGPTAAACLRAYRSAPTTCEFNLFQWGPGYPQNIAKIGEPLERHQWGVFGRRRQWSMQGDTVLGAVEVDGPVEDPVRWVRGDTLAKVPASDYHRLDVQVPAGASVKWHVKLPAGLKRGEFRTAVSFAQGVTKAQITVGETPLSIEKRDGRRWEPVAIPLLGTAFTVALAAVGLSGGGWATFQFPVIDLETEQWEGAPITERWLRSETDLVFDLKDASLWRPQRMTPAGSWDEGRWWVARDPQLVYSGPLDLRLGDFRRLAVTAAVSTKATPRSMAIYYRTASDERFTELHSVKVPLFGGFARTYQIDLNSLGLPPETRLRGLRIDAIDTLPTVEPIWVQLSDVRLMRRSRSADLLPGANDDLVFEVRDRWAWLVSRGMTPVSSWDTGRFWVGFDPSMEYARPFDARFGDYTRLSVTAAASRNATNRIMKVYYRTSADARFSEQRAVRIALADGPERTYQIDLATLGLPGDMHLTGIRLDPVEEVDPGPGVWVQVSDLRLLRRH